MMLSAWVCPMFVHAEVWVVESDKDWTGSGKLAGEFELRDGMLSSKVKKATYTSTLKSFAKKKKASSITISQSPVWQNWNATRHVGPKNLGDAPVCLRVGPGNYWMFGRYRGGPGKVGGKKFEAKPAKLDGYDTPLVTTPFANQYNAPGGLKKGQGGYHAWQSKDMVNWVHHGPVSDREARWMTSAEQVGEKTYLYYDFPNDQDPHLIIDENLEDGELGKKMGMAIKDPSHGSDSAIIRSLDGKFHLILENWDPIKASARSWDSPLASHAVSENGMGGFQLVDAAVDYRTKPTGKFETYKHPHWVKEDPKNYKTNVAKYEVHEPEQDAFGDWAAIAIGGQYYLFGDYDPAGAHGRNAMSTAWFTSSDINKPFKFCGNVGKGHPDPDIMFAMGQFYLVTQTTDYVSPGPWVDAVEVRVGVDTNNDKKMDQWTDWQNVKESYDYVTGFSKQVAKTPAKLDLKGLPEGFGFQFEVRLTDTTENASKPILDKIQMTFEK